MPKKLSDTAVHDRLHRALVELDAEAETTLGINTLAAAKRALVMLQMALLQAEEDRMAKDDATGPGQS